MILLCSIAGTNLMVSLALGDIFHVTGTNLTDKAYQSHLSRLKYADYNPVTGRQGVFNMGRNVIFKITLPLEW